MSLVQDPVFEKLINNSVELMVLRVKSLRLVEVGEREWGSFYSGDCYLVCDLRHGAAHIYYWIGGDSSQDEQAVVAIKAVELDNLFQGMPVQHREVEGYESMMFRKLFDGHIMTLQGGHDSGLKKVQQQTHEAKLFQITGGMATVMREVRMEWSSMNHGDTFILDSGSIIFIWAGSRSSGMEKITASHLANRLRDRVEERIVSVEDGEEEEMSEEELEVWNKHLPLQHRDSVQAPSDDRRASRVKQEEVSLYKCSDMTGTMRTELVKVGNLNRDDLNEEDSFIVNAKEFGIWTWLGRKSNTSERREAIKTGLAFLERENLPPQTPVIKVMMGGEPEDFKCYFKQW